jgi:hypothetical protein
MTDVESMGPIDFLVVEFPPGGPSGRGLPMLVDLVEQGIIRIIDLRFIAREPNGSVLELAIADLDGDGELDLAVFEGAASGLLGPAELDEAGAALEPGNSAAILVYENVWAAPFATELRRSGAELVAAGRIPASDIAAVLDEREGM